MADVTITLRPQIVEATLTGGTLTVVIETGTSLLYDSAGTAQALLTAHTHAGTTNGPKLVQANTHESADTDAATTSLHHTLGTGANQALPGNTTIPAAQVNADWNASGTVAEILNKPTIPTQHSELTGRDEPSQHPASAIDDDETVTITADLSAGAIAITGGPDRRVQYLDNGSATTLEFTGVTVLDAPSIVTIKTKTTGAGITYTFPADTLVSGDAPDAAGEHELQLERNTAGVLMAFLFPTPVVP